MLAAFTANTRVCPHKLSSERFYLKEKTAKLNHRVSYDLKYVRDAALKLGAVIDSHYPKTQERIQLLLSDYKKVVKRNGKYTPSNIKELEEFHTKFYT